MKHNHTTRELLFREAEKLIQKEKGVNARAIAYLDYIDKHILPSINILAPDYSTTLLLAHKLQELGNQEDDDF